ncbi:LysR substrate-binding domain-containing protein [Paludibacterium yongneupense]|uniref:LysR substrate-binding domain-containing protein n=1 Tax=Paludibacterium yongneupense TaxID=400061 RepID=UPI0003FC309F|nr:LysR substrate-binding domain-containing protein [Paludibacterium yongneupense]
MKRNCPTIQELLAFDAVARYKSVTDAANALCITVSAVSKQLSGLESFVDRPLLEKSGRSVRLTPQGMGYWQKISGALRVIETATFELRADVSGAGLLTLASTPTFLTKWLIPRLPAFRLQHPGITLSFSQHLGPAEDIPAGVDAAIRYGSGDWHGLVSEYIAGKEFVVIWSPGMLPGGASILNPGDIAGKTLLHHEEAPMAWRQWAVRHGVAGIDTLAGPRFAQYSAAIQAAVSGLGIALVPRMLVLDELAQGVLHCHCGEPVLVDQGHYLCFRPDRLETPAFSAFRAWIGRECEPVPDSADSSASR